MLAKVMDPGIEWADHRRRDVGHVLFAVLAALFFAFCLALALADPPSPDHFEEAVQAGL